MTTSTTAGSTFTPIRPSALTFVGATVTYDAAHKKAVSDSAADLDEGAAYSASVKGGTGGVNVRLGTLSRPTRLGASSQPWQLRATCRPHHPAPQPLSASIRAAHTPTPRQGL